MEKNKQFGWELKKLVKKISLNALNGHHWVGYCPELSKI